MHLYIILDEDSPYMIFEYMEYGDLADLLRRNDPALGSDRQLELKQVGFNITWLSSHYKGYV